MVLCPNGAVGSRVHATKPDGFMPQRGGGIEGSCNEARWFYAPTGRKGIAQGKAKRRPGIRYAIIFAIHERAGKKPGIVPTLYFNGAPTWKSRKVARIHVAEMLGHWASMGPRLGSRGKLTLGLLLRIEPPGFNGAATWKSRKGGKAKTRDPETIGLQWGRDLEVAERRWR